SHEQWPWFYLRQLIASSVRIRRHQPAHWAGRSGIPRIGTLRSSLTASVIATSATHRVVSREAVVAGEVAVALALRLAVAKHHAIHRAKMKVHPASHWKDQKEVGTNCQTHTATSACRRASASTARMER